MTATVRPYPAYGDSSLDWVGETPQHWEPVQLARLADERKVRNVGLQETAVLSLSYGRIVVKPSDSTGGLSPADYSTYQMVEPGNVILRLTDLQNDQRSLRVGRAEDRGIITSAYICLKPREIVEPRFLYRALHVFDVKKMLYGMGVGVRQGLSYRELRKIQVMLPPLDEQRAIADFLDVMDARITRFIAAKRRMIALLEEKKQAVINQAVTRGLDPDVPLKDSGVDWLGEIPAHWEVRRMKDFLREVDERSESGTEELLSVSHLTGVTPRSEKNITMFKAESYVGHKLSRPGDVVANTMWLWMGAIGIAGHTGIVSPSYAVYRRTSDLVALSDYLDLLLRTRPYVGEYHRQSTGIRSSRLRLYPDQFLRMKVALPDLAEQHRILKRIEEDIARVSAVWDRSRREIELIQEYRTRLITDVVTGKVDVRGVDLPAVEGAVDAGIEEMLDEPEVAFEDELKDIKA